MTLRLVKRPHKNAENFEPRGQSSFLATMSRKVALYISSRNVGEEKCTDIQHAFDTARDYDKIPANPGYIEPVLPSQEWAIALSPEDILTRHRSQHVPQYAAKPIIILDARTANDGSVLVVAPVLNDETGALDFKAIRFDAARVPAAALNIQIGNQSLNDVSGLNLLFESHCVLTWFCDAYHRFCSSNSIWMTTAYGGGSRAEMNSWAVRRDRVRHRFTRKVNILFYPV